MLPLRKLALALSAALTLSPLALHAENAPSARELALQQRVDELERRLQLLEQRLEQQAQAASPAPLEKPTVEARPERREQTVPAQTDPVGNAATSRSQDAPAAAAKPAGSESKAASAAPATPSASGSKEAAVAAAKPSVPVDPYARNGIPLNAPGGEVNLRFRALLQIDNRTYFDQPPGSANDTWLVRRARPILEGTAFEYFDFRIMPDFGNNQTTLPDAYLDANLWPELKFRVGKFKPPVGLERLQSPADLLFAERSLTANLTPNREIGLQASGELLNKTLTYGLGVFNGAPDNSINTPNDSNNSKDYAVRLYASPFRNTDAKGLRGLNIGIAYTTGGQSGTAASGNSNLANLVTTGQQNFFVYNNGAYANGERQRLVPQLYYAWGPFGLLAEYVNNSQRVTRGTNTQTVDNNAWALTFSWVLTGENASYRGVLPRERFDPSKRGWGSLELVGRAAQLTVDNDAFVGSSATQLANPATQARKATDYGIGLSWDLNRQLRVMLDYDQTTFEGGAPNGGNRPDEKVLITRFQYSM